LCTAGIFPCFISRLYLGREQPAFNEFNHLQRKTNGNATLQTGLCQGPEREPGTPVGAPTLRSPCPPRRGWEGARPPGAGGRRPLSCQTCRERDGNRAVSSPRCRREELCSTFSALWLSHQNFALEKAPMM